MASIMRMRDCGKRQRIPRDRATAQRCDAQRYWPTGAMVLCVLGSVEAVRPVCGGEVYRSDRIWWGVANASIRTKPARKYSNIPNAAVMTIAEIKRVAPHWSNSDPRAEEAL